MKRLRLYGEMVSLCISGFLITGFVLSLNACTTAEKARIEDNKVEPTHDIYRKPSLYNLKIIAKESGTVEQDMNSQIFFRIYIDGKEVGRTEIADPVIVKTFTTMISDDLKHSIRIEKYILDENKGRYVRVKKLLQPKVYDGDMPFPSDRITVVTFDVDPETGKTEISIDYEKE